MQVYDGDNDTTGQFVDALCGQRVPVRLQSSGPALFLRFTSDSSTTGRGFTLQFAINSHTRQYIHPAVRHQQQHASVHSP